MNMKKINYLLVLVTIICGTISAFSQIDKGIVIFLKDFSIVLTVSLPFILKKLFKLDMGEMLTFIWIVFIFLAHYLGVSLELYNKWVYFDKVTHSMSGVLSGVVAVLILEKNKPNNLFFNIIFILSFTWFCAGLWEVFEFTCNHFFGGDAQKVVETGVNDTMWDMIVAFIGSIGVSILYYLRRK